MGFFCPDWLKRNQEVTLLHDDVYKLEYPRINDNTLWEFVTCNKEENITFCANSFNIQYNWKIRM